ncbi:MAG: VWA domain-containing protein [Planctomycetes bacterium]|nr:VWA domain-containing protein [Planctomycetota bacterium]
MHLLNPWFLAGLTAIAIPILIHILQRQRIRRVVFPATRFLLGASRKITQTQQLREVALLIMRAAVVALAVAAFTRPFFARGDAASAMGGAPGKAAVLVMDASASMRIGTRMEDARTHALAFLDGCRAEIDRVALMAVGSDATVLVPMTGDLGQVRAEVQRLQAGWGRGDIAAAVQAADRMLQAEQFTDCDRQVVLQSDLQKSGWDRADADWRLSPGTALVLEPAAARQVDNLAITKAVVPHGAVVSARPSAVSLQLTNFGAIDRRGVTVALTLAGEQVGEKSVNIAPGKTEVVRFDYVFSKPGDVTGTIVARVEDDFPADNTWYIDVRVRPRVKVLLVNGGGHASAALDAGRFVKEALGLPESPFAVSEIRPQDLNATVIADAQALVFTDVGSISQEASAAVTAFVHAGGGAMIFCGERTKADDFNTAFAAFTPCRLTEVAAKGDASEGWTFGDIDLQHPIFAEFAMPQSGDLSSARFAKYCRVTDSQASRVVARFIDGRPALLETPVGAGISLLFTSTAGMSWSDFCLQGGIFVPFVHESLKYVSIHSEGPSTAEVGAAWGPSGSTVTATPIASEGAAAAGPLADAPGLYRIDAGGLTTAVAVNLARAESETATREVAELTAALTSDPAGNTRTIAGATVWVAAATTVRERLESSQKIGFFILFAVLALLMAEHVLANQTSRR